MVALITETAAAADNESLQRLRLAVQRHTSTGFAAVPPRYFGGIGHSLGDERIKMDCRKNVC